MARYSLTLLLRLFNNQEGGVRQPATHFRAVQLRGAAIAECRRAILFLFKCAWKSLEVYCLLVFFPKDMFCS